MRRAGQETLGQRLRKEGRLHIDLLQRFGEDLLSVVNYLEDQGIPHRDIKPDNIGVGPVGRSDRLHLVLFDFSLSRTPPERLARARDEHELYFRAHPTETDREYLLHIFDELARLPGVKDIFGAHNPIHELPKWLSGDAAGELLRFFQKIDANTGALVHDFTDPDWNTRFLGDLYQDLSEAARKKYALLQTPEFVEEFILDRTLDPAIEEFGLEGFRMIDPACGSGHFLLDSFARLLDRWLQKEPGTNVRELVQRAWTVSTAWTSTHTQ